MLKGISVWAFDPQRPLPEVFRLAKAQGFEGVEVAIAESGPITPETGEEECQRIVEQAAEAGVKLTSLASGLGWHYPISSADVEIAEKGIALTSQSLRVARWLGVDAILLVPGGVGAEFISGFRNAPYDAAYENALRALRRLQPVALATGVTIAVENVWNKFLLSPLEMRDFIDQAGSGCGVYFDVGNVILTGYPEQWIRILGSRISRIHFKDFKRSVGTLDGFCDLLAGDVDFTAVMRALREAGYDGPVVSEFFNCEADLPRISQAMDEILAR